MYKIGEEQFLLLGTNGFHVKAKNERYLLLRARVVVRISKMKISRRRLADYVTKLHQKHAASPARSFSLIQPTKSLICGVVVVVAVVISWSPCHPYFFSIFDVVPVTSAPPAQRSSIENKLGLSYNFFFF